MQLTKDINFVANGRQGITVGSKVQTSCFSYEIQQLFECPIRLSGGVVCCKKIGAFTSIGNNAKINRVESIGRYCSIADNVVMGQTEHFTNTLTSSAIFYKDTYNWHEDFHSLYDNSVRIEEIKRIANAANPNLNDFCIEIGNDVWIGYGAMVLNNVKIGDGAVVGAGAVVTRNISPYSIVGGVPAKKIRDRFDPEIIERLQEIKWWEYPPEILKDLDLVDIFGSLDIIEQRIKAGIKKHNPPIFLISKDSLLYQEGFIEE